MAILNEGDLVRFVSPASTPETAGVERRAEMLKSWGLRVEIATHAFDKFSYLAGTDDDRLSDLEDALLDRDVRAVFATRGGKGSYRIAHRLAFDRIRLDPKPLIGFSDITLLHLVLFRECAAIGVHGALKCDADENLSGGAAASLHALLMGNDRHLVHSDATLPSAALSTSGRANGPLVGGNLDMIATAAGWALPSLRGAILLIESAGLGIGQFDRALTMLTRAGHFDGVAGIAIGHITGTPANPPLDAIELLRQHLCRFGVPVLGGLPIGHDADARAVLIGAPTEIDATAGVLMQQ
ncbi:MULTISPECIES: LD-carboxypeptidase [unclassified Roseitalea]|uniref:S66 peptidase family protein n=1 Tax=unclassified Roseitalea TaxID=2639107 RepID=UPI00273EA818|nr:MULTISPECIES: LD-carboxypeptidase [unclassified Roseitalea]